MHVRTETDHDHRIALVVLSGALTTHAAAAARRVLAAVPPDTPRVVVDLRALDDVDPSLALVLLEQDDRLARADGWLCLIHGAGRAGSSLRFMGVHDRIRSSPSLVTSGWTGRSPRRAPKTSRTTTATRRPSVRTRTRATRLVRTRRQ